MTDIDLTTCKRIAIMGGTFDPIHYGHLVAAEAVRFEFAMERVVFIPTGIPAHKRSSRVTDPEERYKMTVLATENNQHFTVSRMEIDRQGETYTIDTVKELRRCCPDAEIFFITGADAVHQILTWRSAEELLRLCSFVAVTRPGYNKKELQKEVESLKNRFASRLHFLEVPALAISSTDIRNRVSSGKPIAYLLPEQVERYISQNGLYQMCDSEFIKHVVSETLSERRYRHTLGVFEEARKLARAYGASEEKAGIAALLHDYSKEIPSAEKLALCDQLGVELDVVMRKQPDLTHSFLSAALARTEFGIYDKHILNSIAFHTTGRKKMSKLEKIIFVADLTEQNREPYDGIEKIRELSVLSLDQAIVAGLEVKLKYTKHKDKTVHRLSIDALEYYKKKCCKNKNKPKGGNI